MNSVMPLSENRNVQCKQNNSSQLICFFFSPSAPQYYNHKVSIYLRALSVCFNAVAAFYLVVVC
jgi:hypothetical protein